MDFKNMSEQDLIEFYEKFKFNLNVIDHKDGSDLKDDLILIKPHYKILIKVLTQKILDYRKKLIQDKFIELNSKYKDNLYLLNTFSVVSNSNDQNKKDYLKFQQQKIVNKNHWLKSELNFYVVDSIYYDLMQSEYSEIMNDLNITNLEEEFELLDLFNWGYDEIYK